jgi:hypothetical protein
MLRVVVWLYESPTGHRNYTWKHVDLFRKQFSAHYYLPHEFIILFSPYETRGLKNNFRRLWIFSEAAREELGNIRIFMSDLDVLILDDLTEYLNRPEPFVIMTDPTQKGPNYRYSPPCLLDLGARTDIWDEFMKPDAMNNMRDYYLNECGQKRITGSDMAWLSYYLKDENPPTFNQYRARNLTNGIPKDAKIIHFSGKSKPWDKIEQGRFV